MHEKTFEVTGKFREKNSMKKFSKHVNAGNEKYAVEKVSAIMGSKHGTKRRNIVIDSVHEMTAK